MKVSTASEPFEAYVPAPPPPVFDIHSIARIFVRKKGTNGWNFWRLDPNGRRPLKQVRADYLRVVSPEEVEKEDADPAESY